MAQTQNSLGAQWNNWRVVLFAVAVGVLSSREATANVTLTDTGLLTVRGTTANNEISIEQNGRSLVVSFDGKRHEFDLQAVVVVRILGNSGADTLQNCSNVPAEIEGGDGNDVLLGGSGNDVLSGGAGDDLLTDIGGTENLLSGGDGNDTLWAQSPDGQDTLQGGSGNDTLYSIVGGRNTADGGLRADTVIVRGTDHVIKDNADVVIAFQQRPRNVMLDLGVLYVMGGGNISVLEARGLLFVRHHGSWSMFRRADIQFIAGQGSETSDQFLNMSSVRSVYYGGGGNDLLVGGSAADILKGGTGSDMIFGGGGVDDLSGDRGRDTLMGGEGSDLIRTDGNDFLFGPTNDTVTIRDTNLFDILTAPGTSGGP